MIKLKGDDVINYVTEAPKGLLLYRRPIWYIANVSKKFASNKEVSTYIKTCIDALKEQATKEQLNLSSYKR